MTSSKKSALISTVATLLLSLIVLASPSAAQSYSAANDFSISSNPNGAWSYGWTTAVGTTFNLDTASTNASQGTALSGWLGNLRLPDGIPYVLHNGTASPITLANTTYQPGQLAEQAGPSAQDAVVRWTAPSSGTFTITATFSGLSSVGDSADVHILHNGVSLFSSNVNGSPSPQSFSGSQSVLAGDTIDFVVGDGGNGQNEDTTALSATIVPEPGTLGLVAAGFGSLLSLHFLKRK